jgi:nitrile hydratase
MTTAQPGPHVPPALRTEALEQLLTERGLIDPATLDTIISIYQTHVGPLNGAKVVARAWTDPEYRRRLLTDGTAAIDEMGYLGAQTEHVVVVENTPTSHHVVVCTMCSCYPWQLLGLPPSWYKDPAYRSRVVRAPRRVLAEMGLDLAPDVDITVHDSSAEVRWLVLPEQPTGTGHLTAEQLVPMISREAMVGVAKAGVEKAGAENVEPP